jgi:nucleotide-binding universal stress UspA family protein
MSRMLIATDGSAIARTIPDTLATWGAFHGVIAETISVAPDPARTFELLADVYTLGMNDVTFEDPDHVDRYRGYADQLAQELTERQIPATATVAMGDPGHEIIEAARRTGSDLVVTGTRGLHGIERLILGSVARNVVVHAPCSVLVIRWASDTPDGTRSGRRDHEQARAS